MPKLDLEDAVLDYDLRGEAGPVVVQLHGLMSSRSRDARLGLDLARALPGHRIVRYDARGHGASSGSWRSGDYTWESLAGDLVSLLDHVAPEERVHGVGSSMGAGTLLHAAASQPDRFASLTLITPPTAWATRPRQAAAYQVGAAFVERRGLAAYVELGRSSPTPPALAHAPATEPTVGGALLPTVLRGAALTDLPPVAAVAQIDLPALVLAWVDDPTHPLTTAQTLADVMPRSRLEVTSTPAGVANWPNLLAEHVSGCHVTVG